MGNKPKQEVAPFMECKTCKRRHRADIRHPIKITAKLSKRSRKKLKKKKLNERIEEISREIEAQYLHQMERD